MIIAVNARTLKEVPNDGIGWFTHEVVRRMVRDHPEHRFILVGDRSHNRSPVAGANVQYITVRPRTFHPVTCYLWHEFLLPPVLKRIRADIFVAPDGIIPLRTDVPCLPVIHDLNHVHRPDDIPWVTRNYYRHFFRLFAHKASRIATVSHFSADDISGVDGIDPGLIDVVPNGVAELFSPPAEGEAEQTRLRYSGGRPYFLFVSNFSPRKNIETLIRAYDIFRRDSGVDHVLLIAGRRLYLTGEVERALEASPYSGDILFTGSVSREILRRLYGAAVALTFVPWFEGFGIPVVEAQRCGTPCILSDTSSLPEVSGGAALCTGPAGADAIAAAMARLAGDEALRRRLSQQGIINSARYSWDKTAEEMWKSIIKTIEKPR